MRVPIAEIARLHHAILVGALARFGLVLGASRWLSWFREGNLAGKVRRGRRLHHVILLLLLSLFARLLS